MTIAGKQYGFPLMAEALALVYNKKFVPQAPKTWAEFLSVAKANTGGSKYGFVTNLGNAYTQYGLMQAYGGYVFKNNGGKLNFNDIGLANAGAVQAVQLLNDLRFKHQLVPAGMEDQQAREAFVAGRATMSLLGPWDLGAVQKAGIDFGIAPLPKPAGATGEWRPFVGVQGVMVSARSKQSGVALKFARQITSEDAQAELYQASGRLPASPLVRSRLKDDVVVAGFDRVIRQGVPMLPDLEMSAVWEPWTKALQQATGRSGADVAGLLRVAARQIQQNLQVLPK